MKNDYKQKVASTNTNKNKYFKLYGKALKSIKNVTHISKPKTYKERHKKME